MTAFPTTSILGIPVAMTSLDRAVEWSLDVIRGEVASTYVCHVNVHALIVAQDDRTVAEALAGAGLAACDGMPLVWLGRRRGFAAGRVYGPDFMRALLACPSPWTGRRCRHLLFGSTPQVLDRLAARLRATYPKAEIVGMLSPPFHAPSEAENAEHCAMINRAGADVVWVGLGAPRQELWMARNRPRLSAPLLVGVGAAFDFLAGTKSQAPPWMRNAGLEWAFRLATEPRRLTVRYMSTNPRFLLLLATGNRRRR